VTARLLAELTTEEVGQVVARPPTAALVPVGSVEPHGPHLPLATDTIIAEHAARRAAGVLAAEGIEGWVAPGLPYGVTDFSAGFPGTIGVPAAPLTALLRAIACALLDSGWTHVCLVQGHLEPAHDAAAREAVRGLRASVASPLTKRWARNLTPEFRRGDCHAGRYETSLVLAAGGAVREVFRRLPALEANLAHPATGGRCGFRELGMDRAYTGAPAEATPEEGEATFLRLVEMIVTEVREGIARGGEEHARS
jgi:creatinine amidohydrolase